MSPYGPPSLERHSDFVIGVPSSSNLLVGCIYPFDLFRCCWNGVWWGERRTCGGRIADAGQVQGRGLWGDRFDGGHW